MIQVIRRICKPTEHRFAIGQAAQSIRLSVAQIETLRAGDSLIIRMLFMAKCRTLPDGHFSEC